MTNDPAPPNRHWRFDPTINLGHIMTAAIMAGSIMWVYIANETRAVRFDARLGTIEAQLTTQNQNTTILIQQGADMRNLTMQMNRLQLQLDALTR